MQADRRLVDDVHRLGESAAEGRGEVDALRFAARKRARLTFEREIRQADFVEIDEAIHNFTAQVAGDRLFLLRHRQVLPEMASRFDVHCEEIIDGEIAELHVRRRRLEARPVTLRARLVAAVLRQLHANVNLVFLRFQPLEEAFDAVPLSSPVVEQVPLRGSQVVDRDVEAQVVFFRCALEVLVAVFVTRRVPRRDRQLVQPQRAVGNHLLHVDADDSSVALAVGAGAERRIERKQLRRRLQKFSAAFVAREARGEAMADPAAFAFLEHVDAPFRDLECLLDRFGDLGPFLRIDSRPRDDQLEGAG